MSRLKDTGMRFSEIDEFDFPQPTGVSFDEASMWVSLDDGRIIGVPIVWYPRLSRANPEQLTMYELSPCGIHWDAIDEDVSIKGIVLGYRSFEFRPADAA